MPPMWFAIVPALARKRGRVASGRSDIGELLLRGDSSKAEHGPLLAPAKWQTRVRQQFVCGQIARLAPVKDGFGDVRREIAKTNEPREIGRAHDLDPERFTLRQAAQARDDFAQIMDELEFVKSQLVLLPTRRDQAFSLLRIMFGSAVLSAALVIGWIELFWRHCL
jgi:hypothetical protein